MSRFARKFRNLTKRFQPPGKQQQKTAATDQRTQLEIAAGMTHWILAHISRHAFPIKKWMSEIVKKDCHKQSFCYSKEYVLPCHAI